MTTIKQVRDGATAAIAALSALTSRSIVPRAMWVPIRLQGDALPDVIVVAINRDVELVGRGVRGDVVTLQVGIFENLADDAEAAGAAGHVIADAVIDGLLATQLAGVSAVCVSAGHMVLSAPEQWRRLHQFVGVVELVFRVGG